MATGLLVVAAAAEGGQVEGASVGDELG
jgi:hypothetical protein